jgi:hypothetical protein
MALQFEARKVALKQDRTGFILTLSLHPDEVPEEILRDFVGARYACAVVRINDDESPVEYDNRVALAGILCRDQNFQEFLLCDNETDAAHILCKRCDIGSRTELHGNIPAKAKFDTLVQNYRNTKVIDDPF